MKTILLASTFLFAVAGNALAADAVVYEPTPEVVPAGFVWTGGYVGLHAGYAWSRGMGDYLDTAGDAVEKADVASHGWLGGVQAGYNYQVGNWVIGVEGDIAWSNANGFNDITAGRYDVADIEVNMDWLASLAARAGISMDRTLFYAKGGVGFAQVELGDSEGNGHPIAGAGSDTLTGWTVGGGVEHAVTDNWTVKAEYQFYRFASDMAIIKFSDGLRMRTFDDNIDVHALKVGLNYKF
jgi:outer membrane immunogenic protein